MREAWLERDQPTAPTPELPDVFSFLSEYLKDLSEVYVHHLYFHKLVWILFVYCFVKYTGTC